MARACTSKSSEILVSWTGEKGIEFARKAYYNLYGVEIDDRDIADWPADNVSLYSTSISKVIARFHIRILQAVDGGGGMRKLDFYWASKKEWRCQNENGAIVVRPDAPKEAQESYKRYLKQINSKRGIS